MRGGARGCVLIVVPSVVDLVKVGIAVRCSGRMAALGLVAFRVDDLARLLRDAIKDLVSRLRRGSGAVDQVSCTMNRYNG